MIDCRHVCRPKWVVGQSNRNCLPQNVQPFLKRLGVMVVLTNRLMFIKRNRNTLYKTNLRSTIYSSSEYRRTVLQNDSGKKNGFLRHIGQHLSEFPEFSVVTLEKELGHARDQWHITSMNSSSRKVVNVYTQGDKEWKSAVLKWYITGHVDTSTA